MNELWLRIEEAAAAAARKPGAPPSSLLGVVDDLVGRCASLAQNWLDEAIAASLMGPAVAHAVRADLRARLGDVTGYRASAEDVRAAMAATDAATAAALTAHLAAGAESLGLVDEADALMPDGRAIATNALRAAARGDATRAEALERRPAFQKLDWTSRVPVAIAIAQAHRQAGAADRARAVLAAAEASARRGKPAQLRAPMTVRIAIAYADVGADGDARRLARNLDQAMSDRSEPRGAIEHGDVAVLLHRIGDEVLACEIAGDIESTWVGRGDPLVAALVWARLDDEPRAHRLLDPLDARVEGGALRPDHELASIARVHLALGDVAAAIRRARTTALGQRVQLLREVADHCHDHGVEASGEISAALAEVSA